MSENNINKINKKIEIPKLRLWLIWCLLFVFPSIIAILGFRFLKEEYLYFYRTDIINESFSNLKNYKEIIAPENFLEEQLKEIKKLDTNLSHDNLKKQIDQILCGETFYCVFFNKESKNETVIKNEKAKNIYSNVLKIGLSNLIKAFSANKDKAYLNNIEDKQKQFANTLLTVFKTSTPVTISMDTVTKSFSITFGGELYFIFANFDTPSEKTSGFFAIMQGESFSFNKMLKKLSNRFPEIKMVLKEVDIFNIYKKPDIVYSGIKRKNNNLYIVSPASLIFARHIIHNGSTKINPKLDKLFPFIEYKIPTDKIDTDINRMGKIINYSVGFLLLISFIYFLNISLFGFDPNIRFKTKIILLTLISAIFPFTVFSLGLYSFENINKFITKTQILHQAEVELKYSNQELEHYINEIEIKLTEYAAKISEILSKDDIKPNQLLSILSEIEEKLPISKEFIYFSNVPKNLKSITNDGNKIMKSIQNRSSNLYVEKIIEDNIPPYVIEITNNSIKSKITSRNRINTLPLGVDDKIDSDDIGNSFRNDGKLIPLDLQTSKTWFLPLQLNNISKKEFINSIFFTSFETKPILYFFINNISSLAKKHFKEIKDNYEINYALLPIDKSGSAKIWDGSGNISVEDRKLCLKRFQSTQMDLANKTIIIRHNKKYPHLSVAIITELVPLNEKRFIAKILLSIVFYLLLILLLSNKLLDTMFIEPVMLLASNANQIAQGSEVWNTEIKSGDEFEELNNSFKNLVVGLKERNILKSYVSEDAFSDIESSNETNLKPGGEYMEATIVFSAIKDYDKLSQSISAKESIKLLSKFMSIAEEVTKKYNGSIDKIIGDTIMLVFRNNPTLPSHGLRASQASLELVEKAKEIDLPKLYTGIASGKVISGKIGSYTGKLDFTVIGNPVNSAARFKAESKNGTEKTGIIISGETIGLTQGKAKVKFLRRVAIKGKSRMYNIYELLGIRD